MCVARLRWLRGARWLAAATLLLSCGGQNVGVGSGPDASADTAVEMDATASYDASSGQDATAPQDSPSEEAGVSEAEGGAVADGGPSAALVVNAADPNSPCYNNASENPPGAVFVLVASQAITCAQTLPPAFDAGCNASLVSEFCVGLAPSSLVLGTIDFTAGVANAGYAYIGGCPEYAGCCGGYTNFNKRGTMNITAVNSSSVTFTLSGPDGDATGNGTYTALRCP
jgi:hypothetical protein